ncbi:thioredoxin family protein [Flavilitoribacter nigricans]|uniref:Thioredoxin domain-containing protein n=1 Tax=Flavilitoribacter nigricans (strain ATCC 23147 / DSM 23189 / NBRC 102662 / NCIMB 1420 / SS-2) TaxID=1122177 RepID=A0A2D0MZU3_FLAN2|nr:thioredoxin family protein [Flavilitoribacter nigricans]PHN01737.1 hypothetical protein CRP01_35930 [Flavilitoribacter nigricans DSM 23189 = NBRC 102662]
MKKYILLLLLPLAFSAPAQDGIHFVDESWQKLLKKAEKEDKLIFLDAYTTWCGPCKMMTKDVFPDKKLGKLYNKEFINVQLDMESEEGRPLAKKYNIRAYPSLLYINGAGEVVHRIVGYQSSDQLIAMSEVAMDPQLNLVGLIERYEAGERDPDFLLKKAMAHSNAMDGKHMEALEAYFKTQSDWSTMENMELLFMVADDIDSQLFEYLANNRESFEMVFGKDAVINKLQQMVSQKLYEDRSNLPSLEKVDRLYERAYPDMADKLSARFRIDYYRMAGDQKKYLNATAKYLEQYSSEDAMELNNAAWNFFEMVDDPDHLKLALNWAKKSVDLEPGYYNYDTLAALYFKLGEKKKAIKTAKQAIAIAKSEGENYAATQALLEAIRDK